MFIEPGARIDFGTTTNPDGRGTITMVTDKLVVIAWDRGGTTVLTLPLLEALNAHCRRAETQEAA